MSEAMYLSTSSAKNVPDADTEPQEFLTFTLGKGECGIEILKVQLGDVDYTQFTGVSTLNTASQCAQPPYQPGAAVNGQTDKSTPASRANGQGCSCWPQRRAVGRVLGGA